MQSWTVGESEVEIIPPKFRGNPGRRVSLNGLSNDLRQTVNLTRPEAFDAIDRVSTYDAFGQLGYSKSEVSSKLDAHA